MGTNGLNRYLICLFVGQSRNKKFVRPEVIGIGTFNKRIVLFRIINTNSLLKDLENLYFQVKQNHFFYFLGHYLFIY